MDSPEPSQEEYFKIGFRLGGAEIVGFEITSRSSRMKQWAFFGLITMAVMLMITSTFAPEIIPLIRE